MHRAEGFGRTPAEGMLLGKPVVGTDFSGNTDFLTQDTGYPVKWTRRAVAPGEYPFSEPDEQAWWAEPDVGHAARQMRAARAAAGSPWALQLPQRGTARGCGASRANAFSAPSSCELSCDRRRLCLMASRMPAFFGLKGSYGRFVRGEIRGHGNHSVALPLAQRAAEDRVASGLALARFGDSQ
jgi:hypothetical protein